MKYLILFSAILLMISNARGQEWDQYRQFTRYDTLRGSLTPERSCYDVLYYELFLKVDPDKRHIAGYNKFKYVAMQDFRLLQFELSAELTIDSITSLSGTHAFRRDSLFVFVTYPYKVHKGMFGDFTVYYHGIPHEAKNPPWDGGFVWQLDENENHWVGVSCQGIGSSIWWPSKDHPSDEPDSMLISLVVPSTLTAVANGK